MGGFQYPVTKDVPNLQEALSFIQKMMEDAPSLTILAVRIGRLKGKQNEEMEVELTISEERRGRT